MAGTRHRLMQGEEEAAAEERSIAREAGEGRIGLEVPVPAEEEGEAPRRAKEEEAACASRRASRRPLLRARATAERAAGRVSKRAPGEAVRVKAGRWCGPTTRGLGEAVAEGPRARTCEGEGRTRLGRPSLRQSCG